LSINTTNVKLFIGQAFIVAGSTLLSLLYPLVLYDQTHSTALLGISMMLNELAVGLGSYVWGRIIDRVRERYIFFIILPVSGIGITLLIFDTSLGLVGYALLGFFTALDSPIYSILLLERFSMDKAVVANSMLSQLSLAGNIIGSIMGTFKLKFFTIIIFFTIAAVLNAILIPRYKGDIREDKVERIRDTRRLLKPLISYSIFNLSAEVFYVVYIPLLNLLTLPSWTYFVSYTILYMIDEYIYYISPNLVRDNELYYIFISIALRGFLVALVGYLLFMKINFSFLTVLLFISFGSLYPLYNTALFSLIFKDLKKNRGSILGLFSAGNNLASAMGSYLSGLVNPMSISQAYFFSFFGFSLSFFIMYDYISEKRQRVENKKKVIVSNST